MSDGQVETEDVQDPPSRGPISEAASISAKDRAELCGREVAAVLARFGCRIVPYMQPPEQVGQSGLLVRAAFGIVADAR